jgi:BirA family transcriptional regulator, biotin operon repressor / biotin---[acetyl-CoA-carboxylase] ligase
MSETISTQWRILSALKENETRFVSGATLASRFHLSRTGVWKHMGTLRARGYEIESHPREGYRLLSSPDLLIPEEVLPELKTSWVAGAYEHHLQIGSTNDRALLLAKGGASHGTVVVAEEQSQGRGRLGRPWVSNPGAGIYMSLILRKPLPVRHAPQSTLVAALSLVKVLREEYGLAAAVKWPNDVLIGGCKVAGILTEMQSEQESVRFIVVGIGVNVNQSAEDLAGPFRYPATSLAAEFGTRLNRKAVLLALLHRLELDYGRFFSEGLASLLPDLEATSAVLGKEVTVVQGEVEISGKAIGFTEEGALRLSAGNMEEKTIWAGDITQVKGAF